MKLFFDARFIRMDYHDGISRYSAELLAKVYQKHADTTAIIYDEKQLEKLPKGIPYLVVNYPTDRRELSIAKTLNKLGAEVVFCPMQIMGSRGRNYKLILTLHDLIYYQHRTPPRNLPPQIRLAWWLFHGAYWPGRILLNRADTVVTVSQTSKDQMIQHRLTDRPIEVVYNAPSSNEPAAAIGTPEKTLVFMGTFMPYKNVEALVRAMNELPDYTLHCMSRITPERKAALLPLADHTNIVFHNGVADKDYFALLQKAFALVSASKSEGFGLPLIEALQIGVPVVCSDMPIFHEVGGEAALYFDPNNPGDIAFKIRSLENETIRRNLIKKGLGQAKKFSWDKSAERLLEIAYSLIK